MASREVTHFAYETVQRASQVEGWHTAGDGPVDPRYSRTDEERSFEPVVMQKLASSARECSITDQRGSQVTQG